MVLVGSPNIEAGSYSVYHSWVSGSSTSDSARDEATAISELKVFYEVEFHLPPILHGASRSVLRACELGDIVVKVYSLDAEARIVHPKDEVKRSAEATLSTDR